MSNTLTKDDEIDLRDIWVTLFKRKLTILAMSVISTIAAATYAWTATPIYKGEMLIEVGSIILNSEETNNKPTIIQSLDNTGDLKEIVNQTMNTEKEISLTVVSPKGSSGLIKIICEGADKNKIIKTLENSSVLVLNRLQAKTAFYQKANAKIYPSSVQGGITLALNPIKPKKQLIISVGFISGLILGVFLAFFLEYIAARRNR